MTLGTVLRSSMPAFTSDAKRLLILAWKPIVFCFCLTFLVGFFAALTGTKNFEAIGHLLAWVFSVSLFILAVHRYRILGWDNTTKFVSLRIGVRELRFTAFVLIISIFAQLGVWIDAVNELTGGAELRHSMHLSTEFLVAQAIGPLLAVILVPLLVLVFPAIAVDDPHPVVTAFQLSRGIYSRLLGICFAIGLPTKFVARNFTLVLPEGIFQEAFLMLVGYTAAALTAIALCFIFQERRSGSLSTVEPDQSKNKETAVPEEERTNLGTCPNCEAHIALDSIECSRCKAQFGPLSTWHVQPLRE